MTRGIAGMLLALAAALAVLVRHGPRARRALYRRHESCDRLART